MAAHDSCVVGDIFSHLPLSRGTVNQHLKVLKDAGWIQTTLKGSQIHYCLNAVKMKNELHELYSFISTIQNVTDISCEPSEKAPRASVKESILFLCTGNSCRSQMAEAFFKHYTKDIPFTAYSAGTKPADNIHPLAIEVMEEKGISLADQYPKSTKEYLGKERISLVIFVCSEAEKNCPYHFPFARRKIKMPFDDPAQIQGSDEFKLSEFRRVRDEIDKKIQLLVEELRLQGEA